MRFLGIFSAIVMGVMMMGQQANATTPPLPKPRIMAVYFTADWCPNCKALTPKIDTVRAQHKLDESDILFVTLDLTAKPQIRQSILLAQGLGIGDFLKAQGSKTGYVAVLDAVSKKEVARFDSSNSEKEISAILLKK